jgi:Barrel-sandwich domain of CusB or HlyD membrane-fusion
VGWLKSSFVQLQAISRTEKFDRQMAAAKSLETVMEECLDQDDEIVWPPPKEATVIVRDHEKFAQDQKAGHLCSVPLRYDGKPVAVVTLERLSGPFTLVELQQLRLIGDMAAPRLADLQRRNRWFGARWAEELRISWAKLVGPEHTWAKAVAVGVTILLALLFFLHVPYRVQGSFVLRSDELAYLTAPFDGYIEEVSARPGDALAKNAPLLKFKTAELELDESFALADVNRYQRESEKDRAAGNLAEMRISQAMVEQSQARLDMARYRLQEATIRAPFPGVVVEGDLRERLGAPVKTADVMFRFARLDTLYVEAEVNERDVHEILNKTQGEIAFVSRPREKFNIRIIAIEPAAVQKNEANVFLVRCAIDQGFQPWWRPGMSGVCKFKVENRSLFWIITHRTVDFLRLKLWW